MDKKKKAGGCSCSPILVVDDTLFNLETLKLIVIQITKKMPDTAMDGHIAVDKFIERFKKGGCGPECKCKSFSLILMDINMPIMDGVTATN